MSLTINSPSGGRRQRALAMYRAGHSIDEVINATGLRAETARVYLYEAKRIKRDAGANDNPDILLIPLPVAGLTLAERESLREYVQNDCFAAWLRHQSRAK